MPELVDDGVADLPDRLAPGLAGAEDRPPEDRDLAGQVGDETLPVEIGSAAKDPEELVVVGSVGLAEVFVGGLFLDDHDDVLQVTPESLGDSGERFFDEGLELPGRDARRPRHRGRRSRRRNSRSKPAVVASAALSNGIALTSASFRAVSTTNAGSQRLPR